MKNSKQIQKDMFDEDLRKRIRNVLSYWNKDESLLLNEGVEAVIEVFRDWIKENSETILMFTLGW